MSSYLLATTIKFSSFWWDHGMGPRVKPEDDGGGGRGFYLFGGESMIKVIPYLNTKIE